MIRFFLLCLLCANPAWAEEVPDKRYDVTFSATFLPKKGVVEAHISVRQSSHLLRLLDLDAPEPEFSHFAADGSIERAGTRLLWKVPVNGGALSYTARVDNQRGDYMDARMTTHWTILRLDDIFPSARVRSRAGAASHSALELHGPSGWRFESRYRVTDGAIIVDEPKRRFDRPTGWLVAGKLGIRREYIAGRKVSVAAPAGQGMRRMDIIAFLRWTLPRMVKVFPDFPDRLLIAGAMDDMWRGGLSGPGSVYLYTGLPLISENATSPLLHELVHTATRATGKPREDWIIEGVAEYYSLEILRRTGGISKKRFNRTMRQLADWAERGKGKLTSPSTGANTARAVLLFNGIQRELRQHDAGSLDSVVRKLMAGDTIGSEQLLNLVEAALGARSVTLRQALAQNSAPAD